MCVFVYLCVCVCVCVYVCVCVCLCVCAGGFSFVFRFSSCCFLVFVLVFSGRSLVYTLDWLSPVLCPELMRWADLSVPNRPPICGYVVVRTSVGSWDPARQKKKKRSPLGVCFHPPPPPPPPSSSPFFLLPLLSWCALRVTVTPPGCGASTGSWFKCDLTFSPMWLCGVQCDLVTGPM
jgi:hypothetical protein